MLWLRDASNAKRAMRPECRPRWPPTPRPCVPATVTKCVGPNLTMPRMCRRHRCGQTNDSKHKSDSPRSFHVAHRFEKGVVSKSSAVYRPGCYRGTAAIVERRQSWNGGNRGTAAIVVNRDPPDSQAGSQSEIQKARKNPPRQDRHTLDSWVPARCPARSVRC